MSQASEFSTEELAIDAARETAKITAAIRNLLKKDLKRRGIVLGVSGGIDSSVTAALAVEAIGRERVFVLEMPELHSDKETTTFSSSIIRHLGIQSLRLDISPILEAAGFYEQYDHAVRTVIPAYSSGWLSKIAISNSFENDGFSIHCLVAQAPDGSVTKVRLPLKPYLEIVAATNLKQRTRKMLEYCHADRLNFAVAGTPNRLEYDQGFFVKLGDGAADLKPIAHLYKSQVYQIAEYLGIPEEIRRRAPTTDTYSMPQGQDEFYFSLPYREMDLCLYAKNHGIAAAKLAPAIGLSADQAQRILDDIDTKRATTRYLHLRPLLMETIPEISY